MEKQLNYIDLFAGCGGLSLGLHSAGWKGLFAIEKNYDAFQTLEHNLIIKKSHFNWPEWLPQKNLDIDFVLKHHKRNLLGLRGSVDLVAGGPPCQGFSTVGRRKEDDSRNRLIKSYLKFILYVQPKVIFFENVKGFTINFKKNKSKGVVYSNYVLSILKRIGYDVEGQMIDFSQYGIPQKRTRFILVAIKTEVVKKNNVEAKTFFTEMLANKKDFFKSRNLPQKPTLGTAISDLLKANGTVLCPDRKNFKSGTYIPAKSKYQRYLRKNSKSKAPDSHSFPNHGVDTEKRFKLFLNYKSSNQKLSDKLKAKYNINKHIIIPLSADLPSPTITTLPDDYIHYSEPRILTVREYARIQSFPDWYEFKGNYTTGGKQRTVQVPRYTQIGNAIPPLFGEQTGIAIKELLV